MPDQRAAIQKRRNFWLLRARWPAFFLWGDKTGDTRPLNAASPLSPRPLFPHRTVLASRAGYCCAPVSAVPRRAFWTPVADAAFAAPEMYEYLESEGFLYAIRLPKNQVLQESIAHLLARPVGRPPNHVRRYYASFSYQAGSWDKARRVVAKVEWHLGELVPRVGFVVTNLSRSPERVTKFYQGRGHSRAVDQGRQKRHQLDTLILPQFPQQRGPAPAPCAGL